MSHNADIWIIDESPSAWPGTIVARRLMDTATLSSWEFRIEGADVRENPIIGDEEEPTSLALWGGVTIEGHDATEEELDEYGDELRSLIFDAYAP